MTQIKLHGAQHEFTTLPGVLDDVTDIVLNVKSLVVKNHSEQTKVVRIEKNTRGVITGADVKTDDQVEVINREHVIATLTEDVPFLLEMVIENGRGYVPATEQSQAQEIGIIPLDAAFSPVTRVRYEVDETRVGQKTNYDRLAIEIWTNGSVNPEMALVESAKILRKHLNPFIQYQELGPMVHTETRALGGGVLDPATEIKLAMSLAELDLSVRATNCLESEAITTVRDLVSRTETPVARSAELRRDDPPGGSREAGRHRPPPRHAAAAGRRGNDLNNLEEEHDHATPT